MRDHVLCCCRANAERVNKLSQKLAQGPRDLAARFSEAIFVVVSSSPLPPPPPSHRLYCRASQWAAIQLDIRRAREIASRTLKRQKTDEVAAAAEWPGTRYVDDVAERGRRHYQRKRRRLSNKGALLSPLLGAPRTDGEARTCCL